MKSNFITFAYFNIAKVCLIAICTFFNISGCVILLFEHKQYLQSYDAGRSMQTEISSFKIMAV